jgi:phosphate transport system substrate-binding protein
METFVKKSCLTLRVTFVAALLAAGSVHADKPTLRGAGSTFAAAAYTSWGFSYSKEKGVPVVYQATDSGDGIRQMIAHTIDFGATDYPLSAEELIRHGLIQFPTLVGGVVPVMHLPGIKPGQLKLTGAVLAQIFRGTVTHWNDREIQALNPELSLPKLAIRRFVRAEDSGTTAGFTEYLSKVDPDWASRIGSGLHVTWPRGFDAVKGNEGMATAIRDNVGAIGYVSANQVARAKMVFPLLQNRSKQFVAPTDEALVAAVKASAAAPAGERLSYVDMPGPGVWPITDATYILVERNPKNAASAAGVLRFFYWSFLRGDAMASESGYVPLPASIQARAVGDLRQVRDASDAPLDFMSRAGMNRQAALSGAAPL